jgi:hypothetical protein
MPYHVIVQDELGDFKFTVRVGSHEVKWGEGADCFEALVRVCSNKMRVFLQCNWLLRGRSR